MLYRQQRIRELGIAASRVVQSFEIILIACDGIPVAIAAGRERPWLIVHGRKLPLKLARRDSPTSLSIQALAQEHCTAGRHRHAEAEVRIECTDRIAKRRDAGRPVDEALVMSQPIAAAAIVLDGTGRVGALECCSKRALGEAISECQKVVVICG